MIKISIARDFSKTPGFRYQKEGPYSGEEFRITQLETHFKDGNEEIIEINLDGVAGYATSFLEEAFGGLARKYSTDRCLRRLRFISSEEPLLPKEIEGYIRNWEKK